MTNIEDQDQAFRLEALRLAVSYAEQTGENVVAVATAFYGFLAADGSVLLEAWKASDDSDRPQDAHPGGTR